MEPVCLYFNHTRQKHDPQVIADLPNVLFLLVLLPNHIVHLIQPLTGLFVCLQLNLAVLQGCLGKKKTQKYSSVFPSFIYFWAKFRLHVDPL